MRQMPNAKLNLKKDGHGPKANGRRGRQATATAAQLAHVAGNKLCCCSTYGSNKRLHLHSSACPTPPTCHARRLRCMLLLNNQHVWGQAAPSFSSSGRASAAIIFKLNFLQQQQTTKTNTTQMRSHEGEVEVEASCR